MYQGKTFPYILREIFFVTRRDSLYVTKETISVSGRDSLYVTWETECVPP